jgi:hydroxyacylglutathione hydrolase
MTPEVIPISFGHVKCFLIKGDRPILVDTGTPGNAPKIIEHLAANNVKPADLGLIIITHCHSDHVGSLAALKQHTSAKVASHQLEADLLAQGKDAPIVPVGLMGRLFALLASLVNPENLPGIRPDIRIDRELDLHDFGVDGKAIATPGHTHGSMSVALAGGAVIIGDLLMAFNAPRVPKLPIFAEDMAQVKQSIRLILEQQPTTIHASHGGPFRPDDLTKLL